jgi:putative ABC transport system substrate-binding protein
MRRRDFTTLLGGAAAAWPLAAKAQQRAMPVIGYLDSGAPETSPHEVAAFHKGLGEVGYVEGRNVAIEYRWARYEPARQLEWAADLARLRVAVIVAVNSVMAVVAKAATNTIPIVFRGGSDPIRDGLVASFNRPGGNVTGIYVITGELGGKRLGLVHDLVPGAARIALLVNPNSPFYNDTIMDTKAAAAAIGREVEVLSVRTSLEIDAAFARLGQMRAEALLVSSSGLFDTRRVQLLTLVAHHRVPAIYAWREYAEAGGLMSYGPSRTDAARQTGLYVGRILKGDKPADLPVMQPTKFEFVLNLQTAKTLGLTVPPGLLAIADEVIE